MTDARKLFKILYRLARIEDGRGVNSHPYFIVDFALREMCDIHALNAVGIIERKIDNAVLWALFWNRKPQEKLKLWASARRLAFVLTETESRSWYEGPKLPS